MKDYCRQNKKAWEYDISEANKRYALEVAEAAHVSIGFEACDILEIDMAKYGSCFDVVFMEGGILHYFHDMIRASKGIAPFEFLES